MVRLGSSRGHWLLLGVGYEIVLTLTDMRRVIHCGFISSYVVIPITYQFYLLLQNGEPHIPILCRLHCFPHAHGHGSRASWQGQGQVRIVQWLVALRKYGFLSRHASGFRNT